MADQPQMLKLSGLRAPATPALMAKLAPVAQPLPGLDPETALFTPGPVGAQVARVPAKSTIVKV